MGIQQEVDKAKPVCADVAELLIDKGYTPFDFEVVLSRLIHEEMEGIELQHSD